nr:hypothetical protein Iba_chr15aCG8190 [Ipomoea batatas]GME00391.1 hypothetical protein Iba_chr15fCG4950 [Ipomoea batatas]
MKNYEVELTIKKEVDVSSDDSQPTKLFQQKSNNNEGRLPETFKGIDYDKVVELFFTPKKFEGLVVVKLGEAIEVTANFNDWKYETASWVPQQGNGVDCGAFVMLFMEMDMDDQLKKHTGFNIDMERRRIALELLYHPRNARLSSVLENL